jgi:hypothetical protein
MATPHSRPLHASNTCQNQHLPRTRECVHASSRPSVSGCPTRPHAHGQFTRSNSADGWLPPFPLRSRITTLDVAARWWLYRQSGGHLGRKEMRLHHSRCCPREEVVTPDVAHELWHTFTSASTTPTRSIETKTKASALSAFSSWPWSQMCCRLWSLGARC